MRQSGAKLKKGFSVLEIIFAIVILGVIASIAVPKLLSSKNDASLSSIKQDIRTTTTAIQSYYMVNGSISKISDAVTLNSSTWTINNKKLEFYDEKAICVTIEIDNTNTLNLTINEANTGTICSTLISDGFSSQTYNLK